MVGCVWCGAALFVKQPEVREVPDIADTSDSADEASELARRPGILEVLMWMGLAALGSVMLLATTNQLCQDLAVMPFLWVLPLALYLLSFVLCRATLSEVMSRANHSTAAL